MRKLCIFKNKVFIIYLISTFLFFTVSSSIFIGCRDNGSGESSSSGDNSQSSPSTSTPTTTEYKQAVTDSNGETQICSSALDKDITLRVEDENGNPIPNIEVNFFVNEDDVVVICSDPSGEYLHGLFVGKRDELSASTTSLLFQTIKLAYDALIPSAHAIVGTTLTLGYFIGSMIVAYIVSTQMAQVASVSSSYAATVASALSSLPAGSITTFKGTPNALKEKIDSMLTDPNILVIVNDPNFNSVESAKKEAIEKIWKKFNEQYGNNEYEWEIKPIKNLENQAVAITPKYIASNSLSFSCFGDNCTHSESCCFNYGGSHCNIYNEGVLRLEQVIDPTKIAKAVISLTNTNTQGYTSRYLDYFIGTSPDAYNSGICVLSNHVVPGFYEQSQDPLVIDVTNALVSLEPTDTYYFGVLNDDFWEVSVADIMLTVYLGARSAENQNINTPPILSNGYVTPSTGDTNTYFTFYVDYYDEDGDPPSVRYVWIDEIGYPMQLWSGEAANGTYRYSKKLPAGTHSYSFIFSDTKSAYAKLPSTGSYYLTVEESGNFSGGLSVNITNPDEGATLEGEVTISVEIYSDNGIDKVEYYLWGDIPTWTHSEDHTGSGTWEYEQIWDTDIYWDGEFTVRVVAYDLAGKTASDEVTVTTNNGHYALDVSPEDLYFDVSENEKSFYMTGTSGGSYLGGALIRYTIEKHEPWVILSQESGTIEPVSSEKVTVTIDRGQLSCPYGQGFTCTYSDTLYIHSNSGFDQVNIVVNVPGS